ncbi:MAG: acetylornithine transaminase [Euryarchaeota archaeon]|nr:acetylornithine transaminase [Euryarchaeota archaeon]
MSNLKSLQEREKRLLLPTYVRQPMAVRRAKGMYVWDERGRKYLDFFGGVAVNALGHCHPAVVAAIRRQSQAYLHVSNHYYQEPQVALAERLVKVAGMSQAFLCNSGAEAIEGALKLAAKATGKREFIACHDGFHGRTLAALSLTHERKYRDPFSHVLMKSVKFTPYNDVKALRFALGTDTAALIVEPIQGEGGVRVAGEEFLRVAREACDEKGVLLVLDEIQTGLGRTGKWFAKDHTGIQPDILVSAKALGGGLPLGAFLSRDDLGGKFVPGDHGSTFGGNPVSCAAGLAVLQTIEKQRLVDRAAKMGTLLLEGLRGLRSDKVKEVRGQGLLLGMEMKDPAAPWVEKMRQQGILLNATSETVLRLTPPLIVSKPEVERVVQALGTELAPK